MSGLTNYADLVSRVQRLDGEAFLRLNFAATGLVTDQFSNDVGTTSTSGIYKMKQPEFIQAVSALADAAAIIYLPPAASCPLGIAGVHAPTGATGGDISVYDEETGAEISTYGDLDADNDHVVFISVAWAISGYYSLTV